MKQVSRRGFLQGASAVASFVGVGGLSPLFAAPEAQGHLAFVGTQTTGDSKGIYAYRWNASDGSFEKIGLAIEAEMPTFLTLSRDRRFLFAANETEHFEGQPSGGVSSFRITPGSPKLTAINRQLSGATGPCYVGTDHTGKSLLCANYNGGTASSFLIGADGKLSEAVSKFHYSGRGPDAERQEASHVHRATATPGNGFVLFNDLGLDKIHIYKLNPATAELLPHEPSAWKAPAGSGPRALCFHPNGKWAYCVTEMGSTVIQLAWDESAGTLTTVSQVSMIPPGFHGRSQGAEIVVDREGKFAYASDRYHDMLYAYRIDPLSGKLSEIQQMPPHGNTSRQIVLDPTGRWLLSSNQDSDTITIFPRDPSTGKLGEHSKVVHQTKPQCIVFV